MGAVARATQKETSDGDCYLGANDDEEDGGCYGDEEKETARKCGLDSFLLVALVLRTWPSATDGLSSMVPSSVPPPNLLVTGIPSYP